MLGFQSARPARGATDGKSFSKITVEVSIRAPREGRDADLTHLETVWSRFNPRAPRGARPRDCWRITFRTRFQSARPARGATELTTLDCGRLNVSIRAPREGRDLPALLFQGLARCFNPRAPRGARLRFRDLIQMRLRFQSARPARGATADYLLMFRKKGVSIRAPREGRDWWFWCCFGY